MEGHEITHAVFSQSDTPSEALRSVPTLKLDTFVANQNPPAPFLLKIDVDGAEEMILEGAQEALKKCSVLVLECPRKRVAERIQLLNTAGFELLDIVDFCYYDGYLWQLDLVFINPRFAPPDYVDVLKDGFSIDKWYVYKERQAEPANESVSEKPPTTKQPKENLADKGVPAEIRHPFHQRGIFRLFRKRK